MVAVLGVKISRDVDRLARLEAKRFHVIVNEVRDESILTGDSFLLMINDKFHQYEFQAVRTDRQLAVDNGLLKQRSLEPGVSLNWDVFEQFEENDGQVRKVLITPLGEITPFEARFVGGDFEYIVFVNEENQLQQRDNQRRF